MKKLFITLTTIALFNVHAISYAGIFNKTTTTSAVDTTTQKITGGASTGRIPQFTNDKVAVWKTVIFPNKNQILTMHRHDHDRVLVAITSGKLKITNDKGQTHYLKLVKNHPYYLTKDVANELHTDENMSRKPVTVLVIELL